VLGYLFDSSSLSLRPLRGIPGASTLGNPLPLDFTPEWIEIAPRHEYALSREADSGRILAIDLRTPAPATLPLIAVSAGADRVFFSPLGKAAALYYRDEMQVRIVTGLPGETEPKTSIDLRSVPGVLTALAVSDDGETLVIAASQGDDGSVFAAGPGEGIHLVGPLGRASSIAFLSDSPDVLIADAGRSEILRIANVKTSAGWTVLATRRDGLDQPVAVAVSRDNQTAFAVSPADRKIALLPLNGGPIELMDCRCTPTGLHALASGSVFLLTGTSSSPIYLLDAESRNNGLQNQARILFVPAPPRSTPAEMDVRSPRGRRGR
jgi:hypothetical protein